MVILFVVVLQDVVMYTQRKLHVYHGLMELGRSATVFSIEDLIIPVGGQTLEFCLLVDRTAPLQLRWQPGREHQRSDLH